MGDGEQANRRRERKKVQSQQGRRTAEVVDAFACAVAEVNRKGGLKPALLFSLRATPKPQVSTPLTWPELEKPRKRGDPDAFRFFPDDVRARVKKHGDIVRAGADAEAETAGVNPRLNGRGYGPPQTRSRRV